MNGVHARRMIMCHFAVTRLVFICCVAALAGCGSQPAQQSAPQSAPQIPASPPPSLVVEHLEDCDTVLEWMLQESPERFEEDCVLKLTGGPVRFHWIAFKDFERDSKKCRRIFFSRSYGPLVSHLGEAPDFGQADGYLVLRNWWCGPAELRFRLRQEYAGRLGANGSSEENERSSKHWTGSSNTWELPDYVYSLLDAEPERKAPAIPLEKLAKSELKLLFYHPIPPREPGDMGGIVVDWAHGGDFAAGETKVLSRAGTGRFSMALVVECLPFDQSVTEPSMRKKVSELRDEIKQSPDDAQLRYQAAMALHLLAHLQPHGYDDHGRRLSRKSVDRLSPLYQEAVEHLCVAMENEPYSMKYLGALREHLAKLATLYSAEDSYVEAEGLYKRALAIQERILGPEHPDVMGYRRH